MTMIRHFWIFILYLLIGFLVACQNDGSGKEANNILLNYSDSVSFEGPKIEFNTISYDFGRVYEGERVGWYFKYKNSGDQNLVLLNVSAGCGCTIPDYSKEPLAPGKEGEIKVVFDSNGRSGHQDKSVSVETNGKPRLIELTITADIIEK